MGVSISHYAASEMLDLLIDSDRIDVILENYEEMCKGLGVYEFVFNSFLKRGEVEKGLNFHRALVERGLVPKIVDCNKILKGLCMGNQIGVASDFFDMMGRKVGGGKFSFLHGFS